MHLGIKRVVITGAPGTGKTVVINSLERRGFHCYHEIIRTMTAEAKKNPGAKPKVSNPLTFVDDPLLFNKTLLKSRLEDYQKAEMLNEKVCFYDRGMPDVLAYMDFFCQTYDNKFIETCNEHLYDKLFVMPPWEAIYVSDDERLETFEEALKIHAHLMNTYQRFAYRPILVPRESIEKRVDFIMDILNER